MLRPTPSHVVAAVPGLSAVAFAALFVVGWLTTDGVTPHDTAPPRDWTNRARDSQWNGRISGFLMLLAGFVFRSPGAGPADRP
jgi:hypothetical protein